MMLQGNQNKSCKGIVLVKLGDLILDPMAMSTQLLMIIKFFNSTPKLGKLNNLESFQRREAESSELEGLQLFPHYPQINTLELWQ